MNLSEQLIAAHAENFICGGTIMGRLAIDMFYACRRDGIDHCAESWFNPGFPFRVWRDTGNGYAMGRNRAEFGIDGQARTAAEAVAMAGADGVIVTQ